MEDAPTPQARPSSVRGLVLFAIVCFIVGIAAMGWLLSEWTPARNLLLQETTEAPAAPKAPIASVPPVAPDAAEVPPTAEAHMAQIEERLAIIDQQADSASSDASRAERLMIAFAARRAIDRGTPLGYLEGALMRQFGGNDSAAVSTVIKAGRAPVTLDQLEDGLDASRDALLARASGLNWLSALWQDMGAIAVIRHEGEDLLSPDQRFDRARRALERDRVELAAREVQALPGRDSARDWLGKANRYIQTHRALDRLEAITLAPTPAPST